MPLPGTRRILLLTAIFLAGIFLLDRGFGYAFGLLHAQLTTGASSGAINTAIAKSDRDVIIFGSSRARVHLMPTIIEEQTGHSAYNAGANGQTIYYHRMLERLMLDRGSKPKLFILQVDPENLYEGPSPRALVMAPYMSEDPLVYELVTQCGGPSGPIKALSHTWRYNSIAVPMLAQLVRPSSLSDDGFQPHNDQIDPSVLERVRPIEPGPPPIKKESLALFAGFIEEARQHDIQVVMVLGPRLLRSAHEPPAIAALQEVADRTGTPFLMLDENDYPVFRDPALYKDVAHLNGQGAKLLSEFLVRELVELGLL